jgi:hypothetical protein
VRRFTPLLGLTAILIVLTSVIATPAYADFVDNFNGHVAGSFFKGQSTATTADDNPTKVVFWAVDQHLLYANQGDPFAQGIRGAARINLDDALRVQVDKIRVGSRGGTFVRDDCRVNLNGLTPCLPANSGSTNRAFGVSDWFVDSPTFTPRCENAVRGFFSVRWTDGTLERFDRRSAYVRSNVFECVTDFFP